MNPSYTQKYTLVVAVNDDKILAENLAKSPCYSVLSVRLLRNCPSASTAFNQALDGIDSRYCILVHQDVYLPTPWLARMDTLIDRIEAADGADWAVLGVAGTNSGGRVVGKLWSEGIAAEIDKGGDIEAVVSLDEVLLVINMDSGIRFDAGLPGFHLYGTDIVQTALKLGQKCYAVRNPIIHNDRPKYFLDRGFKKAFGYMVDKWHEALPIPTTVAVLERKSWSIHWRNLRQFKSYIVKGQRGKSDPQALAASLKYENGIIATQAPFITGESIAAVSSGMIK